MSRETAQLTLSGVTRELRSSQVWHLTEVHLCPGHLRLEEPPGSVDVLINPDGMWTARTNPEAKLIRLTGNATFGLPHLIDDHPADPTYWSEWLARDPQVVESTVRLTTLHGRDAWKFACPRIKDNTLHVTVDIENGLLLREEVEDVGVIAEWVSLDLDVTHDPAIFQLDAESQR